MESVFRGSRLGAYLRRRGLLELSVLGQASYLLSTRAAIVDSAGRAQHVIEPLTSLLVTHDSLRIVENGKKL